MTGSQMDRMNCRCTYCALHSVARQKSQPRKTFYYKNSRHLLHSPKITQTVAPVLRFSYYPRFDKCDDEIFADVGYNHRYHQPYWQMLTQLRAVDAMPRKSKCDGNEIRFDQRIIQRKMSIVVRQQINLMIRVASK